MERQDGSDQGETIARLEFVRENSNIPKMQAFMCDPELGPFAPEGRDQDACLFRCCLRPCCGRDWGAVFVETG